MPLVEVDTTQLRSLVASLQAASRVITPVAKTVVRRAMLIAERYAKESVSGPLLNIRSGLLRKAIAAKVEEDRGIIYGRLGILAGEGLEAAAGLGASDTGRSSVLAYAAAHEFGSDGLIVPNPPHQVLTIPLDAAKTPAGVPRFSAAGAKRAFPEGTFWWKRPGNKYPVLYGKQGGKLIPLFLGVASVPQIPAKHFLKGAAERVLPDIANSIAAVLAQRLTARGGSGSAELG